MILLKILLIVLNAFAHGEIKLIECYLPTTKSSKVLRALPAKNKRYDFKIYNDARLKKEFKNVEISLSDEVSGKSVIESIEFSLGRVKTRIKILETPLRKVREGSAQLNLPFFKGKAVCFAVY